jgi:hypothetical protein
MKKTIFIIVLFLIAIFFFLKEDIVAKPIQTKETSELDTIPFTEDIQVKSVNQEDNPSVVIQEDIGTKEIALKEIEHLDISFDISSLSENNLMILERFEKYNKKLRYHHTGVSSNYSPSDLMTILSKENVDFIISVNTIDAFGNYYFFDKSTCRNNKKSSTEPLYLEDSLQVTIEIKCYDIDYNFFIFLFKLDYDNPMEQDYYEMTTYFVDKKVKQISKETTKYKNEYVDLGLFEDNETNGIIVH